MGRTVITASAEDELYDLVHDFFYTEAKRIRGARVEDADTTYMVSFPAGAGNKGTYVGCVAAVYQDELESDKSVVDVIIYDDKGGLDERIPCRNATEFKSKFEKACKEYGITPNTQLVGLVQRYVKQVVPLYKKYRKETAKMENVSMSTNKNTLARLLLAGLQVKAGNPNKARRLLAEFEPEELEDVAEDVVDLVEQASDEEDPFLLGEEADVEEVTEDDFDLSPEDDEEADLEDDVDDVDDIEQDDQDLPPPAVQARLRRQTASLRQRSNNARLIQMASVGKRRIGKSVTAGFLTDDELDAMEEEHGYDVIGFLGKQCIALSKKYLLPEARKGGLFTTNGRSNVAYKTDDGCRITIALAPNGISASFDSPTNQWISADVGRLASTKDLALWQKELKRATKDKEAYDEFTRIAKAILNLAKSGKISFDAPD